jgi:hypothetical protein
MWSVSQWLPSTAVACGVAVMDAGNTMADRLAEVAEARAASEKAYRGCRSHQASTQSREAT